MTDDPEDEINVKNLDFSQFHDLMHMPFTPYCWRMFGGPRRHMTLWWEHVAVSELRRNTLCQFGRHRHRTWRRTGRLDTFRACVDCLEREDPASANDE